MIMLPRLMMIVITCSITIRLMSRDVVPNWWCGCRNQSGSTPSSATRLSTPFEPMIAVFTAPDRISVPTSTTKPWNSRRSGSGPTRYIESPPIRLSRKPCRGPSGMIITAKNETSDVNIML